MRLASMPWFLAWFYNEMQWGRLAILLWAKETNGETNGGGCMEIEELGLGLAMEAAVVDASTGAREGAQRGADRVRRAIVVLRLPLIRVERGGGER